MLTFPGKKEKDNFGRVIFLAYSLLSETIVQNLYFTALKPTNPTEIPRVNDPGGKYHSSLAAAATDSKTLYRPLKNEKNFTNFLLKEIAKGINTAKKLDNHFRELTSDFKKDGHYWVFNFGENDLETEIKESLKILIEHDLIKFGRKNTEKLSPTGAGALINSRRIDIDTNLLFKEYLKNKRGKLTNLEIITLLAKSGEVKEVKEVKERGLQDDGTVRKDTEDREVTEGRHKVSPYTENDSSQLTTILEIDQHRPDRIIFEGKEVKVTAIGFSLIYLLAQHIGEVVSYEEILKKLWEDETDAIYTRIIQHIYKFRRDVLDAIGNNKTNKEKVKDTFKAVSGRGVMLNINDTEIKIN